MDHLPQLLERGALLYYNPGLVVNHSPTSHNAKYTRKAYSYGCELGCRLIKHKMPLQFKAKWIVRPLGGVMLSLVELGLRGAKHRGNIFGSKLRGLLS